MNILLVDDDQDFAAGLRGYLEKCEINASVVHDTRAAARALRNDEFDVVLLDIMLPGTSGLEFLPALREMSNVPVIMLTALGEEQERINGLDQGADDYITKPFSARELVSRLRAAHRRRQLDQPRTEITDDDLILLPRQYKARVGGAEVALTAVECRILQMLLTSRDQILSRQSLYRNALLREESPLDRSLDVHMSNLRRKLGPHPTRGSRIRAVRGLGYTLTA